MPITIGNNVASFRITQQLFRSARDLQSSLEKLSSGQRINRGSDDPAGLGIAQSLALSTRIAQVALRNANDGISAVTIADDALSEISSILSRQAELATQASTGTYSSAQRSAMQTEFESLGSEIERIAAATSFNGIKLISGTQATTFQVGIDTTSLSRLTMQGLQATLNKLGLANTGSSKLTYSLSGASVAFSQSAARLALAAVNSALASLSVTRGTLGALGSRLESSVRNLSVLRENYAAAESRIRDVDIAEEAANFTRLSVIQQFGVSVLAQANQMPNMVLKLLQ